MKIAIVGSRTFTDYLLLERCLSQVMETYTIDLIISGGAYGADALAERFAREKGIPTLIFKPDWDKYGKSAGYKRNALIVNEADVVVAFWDGFSRGTKHTVDLAEKLKKPVVVMTFNSEILPPPTPMKGL